MQHTIWLMAQNEMKANLPHCRRDGGMGRMSSLIHGEAWVPFEVGTSRKVRKSRKVILKLPLMLTGTGADWMNRINFLKSRLRGRRDI